MMNMLYGLNNLIYPFNYGSLFFVVYSLYMCLLCMLCVPAKLNIKIKEWLNQTTTPYTYVAVK